MKDESSLMLIVLVAGALAILSMVAIEEDRRIKKERADYCSMVKMWNDSKHLPKNQRLGWPPYKGGCD